MSDVVLYSSIFGDYEELKEVPTQTRSHDSVCISDQLFSSNTWNVVNAPLQFEDDPIVTSRNHKINGIGSEHEFCIYLDGSFQIVTDTFVEFMLEALSERDFAVFKHPWRDCLYDEVEECMSQVRHNSADLRAQADKYARCGMPKGFGLWATGCFAYRNNDLVRSFRRGWWEEFLRTSRRDQVSFPFVVWCMGFRQRVSTIELDIFDNELIRYSGHKWQVTRA
jgi:hypothetical protein